MTADYLLDQTKKKDQEESKTKLTELQKQLISSIKHNLIGIPPKETEVYSRIGISKNELQQLIGSPEALTVEDWTTLEQIQKKILKFRKELKQKLPNIDNDSLVESQRKKHINKRFNTNDKWLPLH